LRERREDLPMLLERLLARARAAMDKPVAELSPECREILQTHAWPGNLRELAAVVQSACRRAAGQRLEVGDLPLYLRQPPASTPRHLPLDPLLEQVEKRLLALALRLVQGNKKKAADLLEIWRPRLLRRLTALKLDGGQADEANPPPAERRDGSPS
jgi:DNA-binding NtrC family response regulator